VSGAQDRFDGSDRQARGRLMRALTAAPVRAVDAAAVMARSEATAARLVDALVAERLVHREGDELTLGR
jgi:predicted transcriptional regulator